MTAASISDIHPELQLRQTSFTLVLYAKVCHWSTVPSAFLRKYRAPPSPPVAFRIQSGKTCSPVSFASAPQKRQSGIRFQPRVTAQSVERSRQICTEFVQ